MIKILFFLIMVSFVYCSYCQVKAITETGEEVILFEDGTWEYVDEDADEIGEIPTNPEEFRISDNATFLLKSKKLNVGFWMDPKKWSFKKAVDNPEAEYEVRLKDGDLYGVIITEKIEIPLDSFKEIALENAKAVARDVRIVKEEYRTVNGIKVLMLKINGTIQGIKFSYYGYYFSNLNGTVQFITFTSQKLLAEYHNDCEELLNGFVELE